MLTLQRTLDAIWNTYTSPEMSIRGILTNYAKQDWVSTLFHPWRSNKNKLTVQKILDDANNYFSQLADKPTMPTIKSAYLLAAVCALTADRNSDGELEHCINYCFGQMKWDRDDYAFHRDPNDFTAFIDRRKQGILFNTTKQQSDPEEIKLITDAWQKVVDNYVAEQQENHVIIYNEAEQVLCVGHRDKPTGQFVYSPIFAHAERELDPRVAQQALGYSAN